MHVGKLRLALCTFGRADASLQEAHGSQALPVRRLLALLLPIGPPGPAHEEAPELGARAPPHTHRALSRLLALPIGTEPEAPVVTDEFVWTGRKKEDDLPLRRLEHNKLLLNASLLRLLPVSTWKVQI